MGNDFTELKIKIEYLPLKQISHANGLSRLVPKYSEPFQDTIIAALQTDCEIEKNDSQHHQRTASDTTRDKKWSNERRLYYQY